MIGIEFWGEDGRLTSRGELTEVSVFANGESILLRNASEIEMHVIKDGFVTQAVYVVGSHLLKVPHHEGTFLEKDKTGGICSVPAQSPFVNIPLEDLRRWIDQKERARS